MLEYENQNIYIDRSTSSYEDFTSNQSTNGTINFYNIKLPLKFKRLTNTMTTPTKAHDTDACYDLYADLGTDRILVVPPHSTVKIHTGFATNIPHGYYAMVFARSGIATKRGLRLANCVAVIDEPYTGEWMIPIHNDTNEDKVIEHGERIAQFALTPYYNLDLQEVKELDATDRGDGGFGSSGSK